MTTKSIKHEQLKLLAENGGVRSVTIIADANGFGINVNTLSGDKFLYSKVGKPRYFRKLETVLEYLKRETGVVKATIHFEHWDHQQGGLVE